jgi:hypothetical protein
MRIGLPAFEPGGPFLFFAEKQYPQISQLIQIRTTSEGSLVKSSLYLVLDLRNRCNLWRSTALQKLFFVFAAADSSFGA